MIENSLGLSLARADAEEIMNRARLIENDIKVRYLGGGCVLMTS